MKKLFVLIACLLPIISHAQVQKYILTSGTNGYVTITMPPSLPVDYTRGLLQLITTIPKSGDTQASMYITTGISSFQLIPYIRDTNFQNGDVTNGNFPTMDSVVRWTRRHVNKYVGN